MLLKQVSLPPSSKHTHVFCLCHDPTKSLSISQWQAMLALHCHVSLKKTRTHPHMYRLHYDLPLMSLDFPKVCIICKLDPCTRHRNETDLCMSFTATFPDVLRHCTDCEYNIIEPGQSWVNVETSNDFYYFSHTLIFFKHKCHSKSYTGYVPMLFFLGLLAMAYFLLARNTLHGSSVTCDITRHILVY